MTSIDTARSLGVQREWEVYNFFADESINAPDELFVYVNDKGDVAPFSQEEIDLISMWKKGDKSPIEGIEGHHMELVKDNPTNIELAASPDNILFATKEGHRAHLHGGNTHNPTDPQYFSHSLTMDEQFGMTLDHNKDVMTLDFLEAGSVKVGGTMLLYGSLSIAIELYRLRNDPRPWSSKRSNIIKTGIATTLFGGGLSAVGYLTSISVNHIFEDFTPAMAEQFFSNMLAINSSFFAITLTGGLLRYTWNLKKGVNEEQALKELQSIVLTASAEMIAFSSIGLGMDILNGFAADTAAGVLIPDPTGILITLRVAYSVTKLINKTWNINQNKKAVQRCLEIRHSHLFTQAQNKLIY